ncbi:MAG: metalloprotease TldD [Alphaproteobacteria bacterium]|nr:metalloprotease TldD [Alphaproteobacteria bacterium]
MSNLNLTRDIFFSQKSFPRDTVVEKVCEALEKSDIGELFLEHTQSESVSLENSRIRTATFDMTQGFGLRSVAGEAIGYAYANALTLPALSQAVDKIKAVKNLNASGEEDLSPEINAPMLYKNENPLLSKEFIDKTSLMEKIDVYARKKDPRVRQVMASLSSSWQAVEIILPDGTETADIRPLVRLSVSVMMEDKAGRMESGSFGFGGRINYTSLFAESAWQGAVNEAIRQADINLNSIPAPMGEMPVVLGPAWCGVLLHEAVGHGLEGDFNRKGSSAFSGLIGQKVAASGVTVVDDGTIPDRRGSITIDDEGTPSQRTVLIENGILKGYMQDKMNARLMNTQSTGNGRRESFMHVPYPRMTNTFMTEGKNSLEEMIASTKKGLYAVNFEGGQVDITSGKFVFSASEAYLIEDGKITAPVKGATLIGDGKTVMNKVEMVGSDFELDKGVGTCGKAGQSVPVGVGQPSLKISALTVGGTAG